ncbi:MAG: PilN domain-containing protein [Betaproteobacteria bacterium]|nr:PilN domain-containing protein [Betaproteobacteria bacterium]MDH5578026.1 PilN domain-containing protein [Betaproteobacteria bacterium]
MNVRINLLPHREERRQRGRQHFAVLAGLTAILGAVVVGAGYLYIAGMISTQDQRNAFLRSEIAKLDKEIAEIKKLKDEIAALLARKQIIETLQADRAQTVHLLDQLVRQMPEGVYLRQLRQRGLSINVQGYAQSNARVSTLMRNIESSPWLATPQLIEIKASRVGSKRLSEFNMNLQLKRVQLKEAPKDAAKAPAKKG